MIYFLALDEISSTDWVLCLGSIGDRWATDLGERCCTGFGSCSVTLGLTCALPAICVILVPFATVLPAAGDMLPELTFVRSETLEDGATTDGREILVELLLVEGREVFVELVAVEGREVLVEPARGD